MEGRTQAECDQLHREAADDDRAAEAVAEQSPEYSDYLRKRANWKRYLGNGHNIEGVPGGIPQDDDQTIICDGCKQDIHAEGHSVLCPIREADNHGPLCFCVLCMPCPQEAEDIERDELGVPVGGSE